MFQGGGGFSIRWTAPVVPGGHGVGGSGRAVLALGVVGAALPDGALVGEAGGVVDAALGGALDAASGLDAGVASGAEAAVAGGEGGRLVGGGFPDELAAAVGSGPVELRHAATPITGSGGLSTIPS